MSKTAYLVSKWLSRDLPPGGVALQNPHASRTFERDQCKGSLFVPSLQSLPPEGERNPFWSAPGSRLMAPVSPTFLPWDSAAGCFSFLLLFSVLHLHNHYLITWCFFTYNALSYSSAFKDSSVENNCPSPFPTHHQPFSTCPFPSNPNADLIHICTPRCQQLMML